MRGHVAPRVASVGGDDPHELLGTAHGNYNVIVIDDDIIFPKDRSELGIPIGLFVNNYELENIVSVLGEARLELDLELADASQM